MSRYIHRDLEKIVKRQARTFPALAVTGARQTGKSTLLKRIFSMTHTYITLDDPLVRERALLDPHLFLDRAGEKVILDEIQLLPELLPYLKIRIDQNRNKKGKYLLTGSNQFTLTRHLTETLAGRISVLKLHPLSVHELNRTKYLRDISTAGMYRQACLRGFYPEPFLGKSKLNTEWYAGYVQTYLEKDIRSLNNIGNLRDFSRFMRLLAARNAQLLNMSELAKDTGVSVNTIRSWISVLEAGQMIYLLMPFHSNLGKRIIKSPKLYFMDNGLVCFLTGTTTEELLYNGPMSGALFESFVVQEVIKTLDGISKQGQLSFYRDSNANEVDLIIEAGGKCIPVEIKLNKSPNPGMTRQIQKFRTLLRASNAFKGYVVCLSDEAVSISRNDEVIPLRDFLKLLVTI